MPSALLATWLDEEDLGLAPSRPHLAPQADDVRGSAVEVATPLSEAPALAAVEASPVTPAFIGEASKRFGTADNGKPHYTIDQAADQIIRGEPGWGGVLGKAVTVTYAFRATAPSEMPEDVTGFSRFSATQIASTQLALAAWSDVANITFVRAGAGTFGDGAYSDNATILFGNYDEGSEGTAAFGFYPGSTDATSVDGDVWVDISDPNNGQAAGNNYGFHTLTHEIGHAIGLAHPGDYNAEEDVEFTYESDAAYFEDSNQYSIMSYFLEYDTGADFGEDYAATPMLDDIAAAQLEYGANMTTRLGDTVYGFNATANRPWFSADASNSLIFAIWDAGGKDTLDVSGYYDNQLIDLRPGNFSNVGGLIGNIAIAKGVEIEVAKSGSGNDVLYGAQTGSELFAGGGNDLIIAAAGHNYLRGEDGNDRIEGAAGFDDMNGNKGDDTLYGAGAVDWVLGGQGDDILYGDDGDDHVYGNLGYDMLRGGAGADVMLGGQADDTVMGEAGDDTISGDRGDDILTGGAGADTFRSFGEAGIDRITDFNRAEGDRVMLEHGTVYTVQQVGSDTIVAMTGGGQVILSGVALAGLSEGWIFVA